MEAWRLGGSLSLTGGHHVGLDRRGPSHGSTPEGGHQSLATSERRFGRFDARLGRQCAYGKIGAMNFLFPHVRVELLIRTSLTARQGAVVKATALRRRLPAVAAGEGIFHNALATGTLGRDDSAASTG